MFFTHDRSFEEFFCTCIQLLNKTWKEMRATSEDFNKFQVLKCPRNVSNATKADETAQRWHLDTRRIAVSYLSSPTLVGVCRRAFGFKL
ncbi:hypothetical protein CRUP_010639 [Coryphaenoides rupestris]|nr:hypothetical protein CRUP_010639 [Coryphaenoides rupestris]